MKRILSHRLYDVAEEAFGLHQLWKANICMVWGISVCLRVPICSLGDQTTEEATVIFW